MSSAGQPINSAQPVVNTLGGQPDVAALARRLQEIRQKEAVDPEVQKTSAEVAKSTEESIAKVPEIEKKLDGMDHGNEMEKWNADKELADRSTPLVKQFGSVGSVFAILASAFTHRPMVNALAGSAAAMTAIQKGDAASYEKAYDAWKQNTDEALRRNQMQLEEYRAAIDMLNVKPGLAMAAWKAATAKYDDQAMQVLQESGMIGQAIDLHLKREELDARLKEVNAKTVPYDLYKQGISEFHDKYDKYPSSSQAMGMWQQAQLAGSSMTPDMMQAAASERATGEPAMQVIPGWGKGPSDARMQAQQGAISLIMQQNPGWDIQRAGAELAMRDIEYQSGKKSVGQLTTMLGATRSAVGQLEYNINQAKKEVAKLPSSDLSPVVNAVMRGEEKWTGDPAYSSLFFYMAGIAAESARIMSGGQASIAQLHAGAQEEAKGWSNTDMTPDSLFGQDGVMDSMLMEGRNRIQQQEKAIDLQLGQFSGGGSQRHHDAQQQSGGDGALGVGKWAADPDWPDPKGKKDQPVYDIAGDLVARVKNGKYVAP